MGDVGTSGLRQSVGISVSNPDLCLLPLSPAIECPVRWSHLVPVTHLPLECFGPHWSSHSGQSEGVSSWGVVSWGLAFYL